MEMDSFLAPSQIQMSVSSSLRVSVLERVYTVFSDRPEKPVPKRFRAFSEGTAT